jgi:hypothetical protein
MHQIDKLFLQSTLLHAKFEEVWLPIKGYSNYEVSSVGRVRNIKRKNKLKNLQTDKAGYKVTVLFNNTHLYKHVKVHRLVTSAFHLNQQNKSCVDHIDGNRSNNKVSNLRWSTFSENAKNIKKISTNISGVTGVSWNKQHQKWQACISISNRTKHLGFFDSLATAKRVRIAATTKYYGEFANKATNK